MGPKTNVPTSPRGATARHLAKLQRECPGATPAERLRFLAAKDGNYPQALEQLRAYLSFRAEHGLDDVYHCTTKMLESCSDNEESDDDPTLGSSWSDSENDESDDGIPETWHSCASDEEALDELDWRFASKAALAYERKQCSESAIKFRSTTTLPQLARILPPKPSAPDQHPRDQKGCRILQFLPARMDLSRASDAAFALSIALYLERKLDRTNFEKVTVAIDVRGGAGWANPRPQKLLPFIKLTAGLLEQNFPERLERCIVFPVPAAATLLWKVIRAFLDPTTATKIELVKGDSRNHAPPPYGPMEPHVAAVVLKHMEDFRCSSFVYPTKQRAVASRKKRTLTIAAVE